jgi:hypothetical protein
MYLFTCTTPSSAVFVWRCSSGSAHETSTEHSTTRLNTCFYEKNDSRFFLFHSPPAAQPERGKTKAECTFYTFYQLRFFLSSVRDAIVRRILERSKQQVRVRVKEEIKALKNLDRFFQNLSCDVEMMGEGIMYEYWLTEVKIASSFFLFYEMNEIEKLLFLRVEHENLFMQTLLLRPSTSAEAAKKEN